MPTRPWTKFKPYRANPPKHAADDPFNGSIQECECCSQNHRSKKQCGIGSNSGWICTRLHGHAGPHVACSIPGHHAIECWTFGPEPTPPHWVTLLRPLTASEKKVYSVTGSPLRRARISDRFYDHLNQLVFIQNDKFQAKLDRLAARWNTRQTKRGLTGGIMRADCLHFAFQQNVSRCAVSAKTICSDCRRVVHVYNDPTNLDARSTTIISVRLQPEDLTACGYLNCGNCGRFYTKPTYAAFISRHPELGEGFDMPGFTGNACPHCWEDYETALNEGGPILEYHALRAERVFSWRPVFTPATKALPYLGVELEVECHPERRRDDDDHEEDDFDLDALKDVGEIVKKELEGFAFCCHDGSIDYGFEIVSAPAVLAEHYRAPWKKILDGKIKPFQTRGIGGIGLHVNLNRACLTNKDAGKLVCLVHSNASPFSKIARRASESWAKFTPKSPGDALAGGDKYQAVNVRKDRLEFRIFRSTTNELFFFASLETVDSLRLYTQECGEKPLSFDGWLESAYAHRREFTALHDYLKALGFPHFESARRRLSDLNNHPNIS